MYYTKKSKEAQLHSRILSVIFLFVLIIPTSIIVTNIPLVHGQTNQTISDNADLLNIQDIPAKKVKVGDTDIGYKILGKGEPILFISGASSDMNDWDASSLGNLSSNHTVIVFDNRGVGITTFGSKPYTIQQLANDSAGLLDALKIQKADVLGLSLGSYVAQQLTIMYPDKVNSLTLVGSSCGGKDHTPKPPELLKLQSEITNKSLNNIPISQEESKSLLSFSLGSGWIKLHPESLENIPEFQDMFSSIPANTIQQQKNIGSYWEANPNWSGACDDLAKIAKPTLVVTGTDDNAYQPHVNSIKIVEKIPGAWLIQIKDTGHAVMGQYPDKINRVLETFLSTTTNRPS